MLARLVLPCVLNPISKASWYNSARDHGTGKRALRMSLHCNKDTSYRSCASNVGSSRKLKYSPQFSNPQRLSASPRNRLDCFTHLFYTMADSTGLCPPPELRLPFRVLPPILIRVG